MASADSHGHHDWHSREYVDRWIATDAGFEVVEGSWQRGRSAMICALRPAG